MTNSNEKKPVTANTGITAADNHEQGNGQKPDVINDGINNDKPDADAIADPSPVGEEKPDPKDGQQAANGDDELVSQPRQQADSASKKSEWPQQVGDAKNTWNKLSNDELLKSEGEEQKLTALVQQRYAISRDEAGRQVKRFIDRPNAG